MMRLLNRLKDKFPFNDLTGLLEHFQSGKFDIHKLLNNEFMQKYTDFNNVGELLGKLGISDTSQLGSFLKDKGNRKKADKVINEHSKFSGLKEMLKKALKK